MIRILSLRAILGALVLTLPFAAAARGELITVQFAGTVTSVSVRPIFGLENFDFPDVGDPFTGFYTFDSTAQDTANSPEQGSFHTVLPNKAVEVSIGEFQFLGPISFILTFQDYYEAGGGVTITSDPPIAQILDRNNFSLVVTKANLFPDPNVLPSTTPSLAGATGKSLTMWMDSHLNLSPDPFVTIAASLDSLTVVPEPPTFLLVGITLIWPLQSRIVP